jgi:hypothetical protein
MCSLCLYLLTLYLGVVSVMARLLLRQAEKTAVMPALIYPERLNILWGVCLQWLPTAERTRNAQTPAPPTPYIYIHVTIPCPYESYSFCSHNRTWNT